MLDNIYVPILIRFGGVEIFMKFTSHLAEAVAIDIQELEPRIYSRPLPH